MAQGYSPYTPDEALRFQTRRAITALYKNMLVLLEDITDEHDIALTKLVTKLPAEYRPYVELADYLTEERAERMRSKVLGMGNDAIRQMNEQLDQYIIDFKGPL